MRVNFLGASDGTPLSKSFKEIAPGTFKETSYPNVARFNSIERNVDSLYDFYLNISACAAEGLCLLKGQLDKPLIDESRAGHTDSSTHTRWVCLDVDTVVTDQTPEEWLDALSPEFQDVSFIFHRSASMGIRTNEGWRGHFYILLDSPQSPQALKQWLIQRNLVCISLQTNIGLSASGGALTYPLDVTTCQNDKLLYIAPPACLGFDDPVEQRFQYVERRFEAARLDLSDVSAATNQALTNQLITELRKRSNLEPRKFKTTKRQGLEILTNPDPITVTGKKEERGFIYLNLNGGDSWGYYFPEDNPEILYNFKGEPCLMMQDVDKEIYEEYSNPVVATGGNGSDVVPFGFLWPRDDSYYRGFANVTTGELEWLESAGSKGKLRDFFTQHGVQLPKGWAVEEWQLTFDPTTEGRVDFNKQTVNTYKMTEPMRNARRIEGNHIPPVIDRVLTSVCVNDESKQYFLNWLASIFQTRQKTNTAWIFQGVQGTGKGVLFTHIIVPLIGREYCHEMTMDRLDDDFNAYLANNIILFIDEAKISDSKNGDRLLNRIKNLVTEPEQHIRGMRKNAVTRPNYSNIILASNYNEILHLEGSDRRFNVAPRQETPIQLDYDDIVTITNELPAFADFLHSYQVDHKAVKRVLLTDARQQLIMISETTVTSFFNAIKAGDLSYFTQYLSTSVKADVDSLRYHDYAIIVHRWVDNVGKDIHISREDLRIAYQYLQSTSISATKFARMCSHNNLDIKPVRIDGAVTRGIYGHRWELAEEEFPADRSNVVPIKERK